MKQPPTEATKDAWRAWAREVRARLDAAAWRDALTQHLLDDPRVRDARWVAGYAAFGSEASLAPIADALQGRWALPRVTAHRGDMTFHDGSGPLTPHPLGMQQPAPDAARVADDAIDLVLVPGLAFDVNGGRLGYGGGFYDAWLARLPAHVPRVGVTHEALVVPALPTEKHDQRVDELVTNDGYRRCAPRAP